MNVNAEPYGDPRVRRAAQLAVDNAVVLELGLNNKGLPAANHHVSPVHIEYADIGPHVRDVEQARKLLAEAGKPDHEYELISLDDDWQKSTADAIAGQIRDAGLKVSRKVIPAATFWNDWTKYPFSCTEWLGRPLVQKRHAPQGARQLSVTVSPTRGVVTPSPISSTTPVASWPRR